MDDNNISERLKALATGKNRSVTVRLKEKFDEIEVALSARADRKDVYQALVDAGYAIKKNGKAITFKSFELAINRIRKERTAKGQTGEETAKTTEAKTDNGLGYSLELPKPKTFKRAPRKT